MNLYIFWTAKGDEAESQQVPFAWLGDRAEGERLVESLKRRVTNWYVSNGYRPRDCQDLNLIPK